MREVDFLPSWYPAVRRQRAAFRVQVWTSAVILIAAIAFVVAQRRTLFAAEVEQRDAAGQLAETRSKVRELDEQVRLQAELLNKQNLVAQLGLPVELTRVITEVGDCMPSEMSLDEMNFGTVETERTVLEQQRGRAGAGAHEASIKSRRLRVQIAGVAPTDSQVYSFFGRLADRRFFENVRLDRTSERRTSEHVMREFAVSFEVPLDYVASAAQAASARE